jgi:hypothetical protein
MALGGCVGEAWTQKALVALENFNRKKPLSAAAAGDACCAV